MADLGSIGKKSKVNGRVNGGTISGTVYNDALAPTRRMLRAYHRGTGDYSGGAFSDPSTGTYAIYTNIGKGLTEHTVMEYDDDVGSTYNTRTKDRVVPL